VYIDGRVFQFGVSSLIAIRWLEAICRLCAVPGILMSTVPRVLDWDLSPQLQVCEPLFH